MNIFQQKHDIYRGIQKAFEKALHTYDDETIVQRQACNLLLDCLVHVKSSPQQILDLGCGTGLMTTQLCKIFRISSLHINDFSQVLLDKAWAFHHAHRSNKVHPNHR